MTASLAFGREARDQGTGRAREIQRDVQVDGGGLRFAGAVVHDQDVVAGLADAEIERSRSADFGYGQDVRGASSSRKRSRSARVISARRTFPAADPSEDWR